MADNGCPVVQAALKVIWEQTTTIDPFSCVESTDWDELAEEAAYPVTDETARLRAFYALELLYDQILPYEMFAVLVPLSGTHYAREAGAIAQLMSDLARIEKRLNAQITVAALTKEALSSRMQRIALSERAAGLLPLIQQVAGILLGCLRRGDVQHLDKVGELLVACMMQARLVVTTIESELRTILTINKENAITPWQKKNYPA
jgi:hypothetical protein